MDFLKDISAINKIVFKKSNKTYIRNLKLIPAAWLYILMYTSVTVIMSVYVNPLGEAGQFITGIVTWFLSCFLLSDYFSHIESALSDEKFAFDDMKTGGQLYFRQMLTMTAVPRIIVYLIARLTGMVFLSGLIVPFILIFAIIEIVYQKHIDGLDMFSTGAKFLKENWKHWLLVNSLLLGFVLLFLLVINTVFSGVFNSLNDQAIAAYMENKIGTFQIFITAKSLLTNSLLIIPVQYCIIYRGYIFKILSVSSRRKREYMRNIYGK